MYRKQIVYDRKTKDFAYYLNGELVGYAATYLLAEQTLNKLVYDLLSKPGTVGPSVESPALETSAPHDDIASDDACVA